MHGDVCTVLARGGQLSQNLETPLFRRRGRAASSDEAKLMAEDSDEDGRHMRSTAAKATAGKTT